MRNPPARLTLACGLLALFITLVAGLNGAERGLGTLVGAETTPSVAYFSRCAPGIYDLAVLGQRRQASLVLPLGRIDAAGRTVRLSAGRSTLAINFAPTVLRPGTLDQVLDEVRDRLTNLAGGAGQVIRSWLRRVKS